ncbi:hypothetical protein B484DRAFT_433146 [Ochromonadaceae sp. CCMP2298]|nr:hypothetical protein B484DRAFT_433146 [Ochromonadaceae sp. CCMP2298]
MPTAMLLTVVKAKLDEGLLQAASALKTTGTSFVEDSESATRGASLDNKKYTCNAKKEVASRMSKNMSLTRVLPDERFAEYAPEIVLDFTLLEDTCKILSDTRVTKVQGDVDYGLQDYNHIKHLPLFPEGFGEGSRVRKALRTRLVDRPTEDVLRAVANNMQRFCAMFFGPEFRQALKPLIDSLDHEAHVSEDFESRYILWRLNLTLQQIGIITHFHKQWQTERDLATVARCAQLTGGMFVEELTKLRARTTSSASAPRSQRRCNSECPPPPLPSKKRIKNKKRETLECGNKDCKYKHRKSFAKTEARVAGKSWIRDAELRTTLKEQIAEVPDSSWKTATGHREKPDRGPQRRAGAHPARQTQETTTPLQRTWTAKTNGSTKTSSTQRRRSPVESILEKMKALFPSETQGENLERARRAVESSFKRANEDFTIDTAFKAAGDFHFDQTALDRDMRDLQQSGYDLEKMLVARRRQNSSSRLSARRVREALSPDNPELELLREMAQGGVRVSDVVAEDLKTIWTDPENWPRLRLMYKKAISVVHTGHVEQINAFVAHCEVTGRSLAECSMWKIDVKGAYTLQDYAIPDCPRENAINEAKSMHCRRIDLDKKFVTIRERCLEHALYGFIIADEFSHMHLKQLLRLRSLARRYGRSTYCCRLFTTALNRATRGKTNPHCKVSLDPIAQRAVQMISLLLLLTASSEGDFARHLDAWVGGSPAY